MTDIPLDTGVEHRPPLSRWFAEILASAPDFLERGEGKSLAPLQLANFVAARDCVRKNPDLRSDSPNPEEQPGNHSHENNDQEYAAVKDNIGNREEELQHTLGHPRNARCPMLH